MVMLILAILIVCMAHGIRIYRWSLFVDSYEKPDYKSMTVGLACGYIVNYFVPFKLGDFLRAFIAGRKMKNGKGFSLATVVIERCMDVLFVGLMFGVFYLGNADYEGSQGFLGYLALALAILLFLVLAVVFKTQLKKAIRLFSGIFNEKLEERLLRFFWALVWGFKDVARKMSKSKLIISTIGMWGLYILSYWCFAKSLGGNDYRDVFFSLFAVKSLFAGQIELGTGMVMMVVEYAVFLLVPSIIMLLAAPFLKSTVKDKNYVNLIPHVNADDRRNFLETYFSADNANFVNNYLAINRKIYVLRDYSAGSNATTILCNDGEKNFYRKYAFSTDGDKLFEQVKWLEKYNSILPLPAIIAQEKNNEYCYYDMPYSTDAVGLFDYAHSAPVEEAWKIIQKTFEKLEDSLYKKNSVPADRATIEKYVTGKVTANIKKIYEAPQIKPLLKFETIVINGREYKNLPYYEKYLTASNLEEIFIGDTYSDIHGDMTIENIICVKNTNSDDSFYIIDPNTGNVHNSPNLDYAKMLQSIHGNYEFLMATKSVEVSGNAIDFKFIKSDAYDVLLKNMDEFMTSSFDMTRVKSIYYHEIIHWLRLMPYKINKNGKRALLFYAGLLMVLDDVIGRFDK